MPKKTKLSISAFDIRQQSEDGIKISLVDPRTGEPTDEWLKVRGDDSEAYKLAQANYNADRLEFIRDKKNKGNVKAGLKFDTESERKLVASLVSDWSLTDDDGKDIPCTPENVQDLFYRAPQIQDQVSQVAGDRRNFSSPSSAN